MWWLSGCGADLFFDGTGFDTGLGPDAVAALVTARVTAPAPSAAPLVRRVELSGDRPFTGTLRFLGQELVLSEARRFHARTLVGLPAGETTVVTVSVEVDGGAAEWRMPIALPSLPDDLPRASVALAPVPALGDTLVPLHRGDGAGDDVLAVFDGTGSCVWWAPVDGPLEHAASVDDGFLVLVGGASPSVRHLRFDGVELARFSLGAEGTPLDPGWDGVLGRRIAAEEDGRYRVLARRPLDLQEFPASYDDPDQVRRRRVADDVVVWFDRLGTVTDELPVSSFWPLDRIGYGSLDPTDEGWADWAHTTAVVDERQNRLVTLRNQDAIVSLDDAGAVRWVVAPEGTLPEDLEALRLRPRRGATAPWHPLDASLSRDQGHRRLAVLESGAFQAAPGDGAEPVEDPATLRSRVVVYGVDEQDRALRERWSWDAPDGGSLFTEQGGLVALGEGRWLVTLGALQRQPDGTPNAQAGLGDRSVWLVELAEGDGEAIEQWRLVLDVPSAFAPGGWSAGPAERLPALVALDLP